MNIKKNRSETFAVQTKKYVTLRILFKSNSQNPSPLFAMVIIAEGRPHIIHSWHKLFVFGGNRDNYLK